MRKLAFILFFVIGCLSYNKQKIINEKEIIIDHWEVMYNAICKTESEFDHLAYNKTTGASVWVRGEYVLKTGKYECFKLEDSGYKRLMKFSQDIFV